MIGACVGEADKGCCSESKRRSEGCRVYAAQQGLVMGSKGVMGSKVPEQARKSWLQWQMRSVLACSVKGLCHGMCSPRMQGLMRPKHSQAC